MGQILSTRMYSGPRTLARLEEGAGFAANVHGTVPPRKMKRLFHRRCFSLVSLMHRLARLGCGCGNGSAVCIGWIQGT